MDQSETNDGLKIKVLNVSKKELLQRPAAGAGVRPERAVQEGLRRRVRRLRRRAVCGAGRATTSSAAGRKTWSCWSKSPGGLGRACAVPFGGFSGADEPERLHAAGRAARHVEDLRQHGVRQVEELPAVGRLALCGADAAARPDALSRTARTPRPIEAFDYRGSVDGTRPLQVPVGQRGVRPGRRG